MSSFYPNEQQPVLHRILWLYGLHTLLTHIFFVIGYYLLPEGLMRSSPTAIPASFIAHQENFWRQFSLTFLTNLGWMGGLGFILNLNRIRGFPVDYLIPISLGITGGLILGTNSFVSDDLSHYTSVREALVLGITIGGLEILGYICIVASTVNYGIYHYRSWWRWSGEWKSIKTMNFREVRLSLSEKISLAMGIILIWLGALRETNMALLK